MRFTPQRDERVERTLRPSVPEANLMDVWDEAQELASQFWDRTSFRTFNQS